MVISNGFFFVSHHIDKKGNAIARTNFSASIIFVFCFWKQTNYLMQPISLSIRLQYSLKLYKCITIIISNIKHRVTIEYIILENLPQTLRIAIFGYIFGDIMIMITCLCFLLKAIIIMVMV